MAVPALGVPPHFHTAACPTVPCEQNVGSPASGAASWLSGSAVPVSCWQLGAPWAPAASTREQLGPCRILPAGLLQPRALPTQSCGGTPRPPPWGDGPALPELTAGSLPSCHHGA